MGAGGDQIEGHWNVREEMERAGRCRVCFRRKNQSGWCPCEMWGLREGLQGSDSRNWVKIATNIEKTGEDLSGGKLGSTVWDRLNLVCLREILRGDVRKEVRFSFSLFHFLCFYVPSTVLVQSKYWKGVCCLKKLTSEGRTSESCW